MSAKMERKGMYLLGEIDKEEVVEEGNGIISDN